MSQYARSPANTRPSKPRPAQQARSASTSGGRGTNGIVSGGARGPSPVDKTTMARPRSSAAIPGPGPNRNVAYEGRKR